MGAPGALAYDVSFNNFGLRICFLGISQTLSSYARRFCRRLVAHHTNLLNDPDILTPSTVDIAVAQAKRLSSVSKFQKREIISELVDSTASNAAKEGSAFLKSCNGAVCLAQGDLLPKESVKLLDELKAIFRGYVSDDGSASLSALPELKDIVYKPMWKPRLASPCSIPGVLLVSDACGRVLR